MENTNTAITSTAMNSILNGILAQISQRLDSIEAKDSFSEMYWILQQICSQLRIDRTTVYLIDTDFNAVLMEFLLNHFPSHCQWTRNDIQSHFPWLIQELHKQKTIKVNSFDQLPGLASVERELIVSENCRSIIWIAVTDQNKLVAILEFCNFSSNKILPAFPPSFLAILSRLIGNLLERKRYYDRSKSLQQLYEDTLIDKNNELTTILNIQKVLTTELHISQVIKMICDEVRRLIDTRFSSVSLFENGKMRLQVISGPLSSKIKVDREFSLKHKLSESTLKAGSSFRVKPNDSLPRIFLDALRLAKSNSLLIMPLVSGNILLGMIAITEKDKNRIDFEDERLLKMFANTAIIAIDNARSYQDEQNRREEAEKGKRIAEALRDILRILNTNTALNEILDYIALQSRELLNASSTMIRKIDYQKGTVFTEAACNLPPEFDLIREIPFYPGGSERILKANVPVAVPNLKESLGHFLDDPNELSSLQRDWARILIRHYKSHLIIPLIINGELYGTLTFYFTDITQFSEEDQHIAMTLGSQVSLAIENARLRNQEKEIAIASERNRLARDLHDAVTQTLFSASLIAEVLPQLWEKDQKEGLKRLTELRQLTRGALAEMRTLLLELRPSALQDASFPELLKQLVEALNGRTRLPVDLRIDLIIDLPVEVKIAFYRITQEALNNIAKHANANSVRIELFEKDGRVFLIIKDDGSGMSEEGVPSHHLGLGIMQERAQNIHANLQLASEPGLGTEVCLSWDIADYPESPDKISKY